MSAKDQKFELYDFTKADGPKNVVGTVPAIIIEKFLSLMRQSLRRDLHIDAKVELKAQTVQSVEAWQSADHTHHVFGSLSSQHPKGHIIIECSDALVGHLINLTAGGNVKFSTPVPLPLSSINEKTCIRFCVLLAKDLLVAWSLKHFDLKFHQIETNPRYFHFLSMRESLLRLVFEVELDGKTSEFSLLFPTNFLNLFKKKWQHTRLSQTSETPWAKDLTGHLKKTSLHITVQLGQAELTIEELLKLGVGDLIVLDQKTSDPLKVLVEGIHKLNGRAGVAAGYRAVRILKK